MGVEAGEHVDRAILVADDPHRRPIGEVVGACLSGRRPRETEPGVRFGLPQEVRADHHDADRDDQADEQPGTDGHTLHPGATATSCRSSVPYMATLR